ncbi:MAG TPA: hypothetical protein VI451_14585 [Anaerolineales bacterium]|nr:hypothetical protein [Anaerolineales bacterium]
MTRRRQFFLFILGFGVVFLTAMFQKTPGYMDADYYLLGGLQLAQGKGFTEPILWNYLDDPAGLPHPSHAYWMPLTSILTAISVWLTPFDGFAGGRVIFLILAGFIPPMTAWLAWGLLPDRGGQTRQRMATLAGALAIFPGSYLSFFTVPDAFALYMILGALLLGILSSDGELGSGGNWFILGVITGLMHLTRADGFIWLGVAIFGAFLLHAKRRIDNGLRIAYCIAGYLIVMSAWFFRNLSVFGTLLAPGGSRVFWMLNYDELFSFPGSALTFERWWGAGLGEILSGRLWALGLNLETLLGVQGQIFLLPMILVGLWRLRGKPAVRLGVLAWGATLGVMTLVFPFSGARGGFFHSGAAVQPLFWAVVPVGLEAFVEWGSRVRGWRVGQAQKAFGVGLLGLAGLLTGVIFWARVLPGDSGPGYRDVEQKLATLGAQPDEIVMVNNPPGYYLVSGRPSVVIPNGDEVVLLSVAKWYAVRYVVLDENIPAGLRGLHENPSDAVGLVYLGSLERFQMFEVVR